MWKQINLEFYMHAGYLNLGGLASAVSNMKSFEMRIKANRLRTVNLVSTSASRAAPACTGGQSHARINMSCCLPTQRNIQQQQWGLGEQLLSDPGGPGVQSLGVHHSDMLLRLFWCDSGWWRPQMVNPSHLQEQTSPPAFSRIIQRWWGGVQLLLDPQAKWGIAVWLIYWRNFTYVISGGFIPSYISHQQKTR